MPNQENFDLLEPASPHNIYRKKSLSIASRVLKFREYLAHQQAFIAILLKFQHLHWQAI